MAVILKLRFDSKTYARYMRYLLRYAYFFKLIYPTLKWRKFATCVFFMITRVCNPANFRQNCHHSIYSKGYKMQFGLVSYFIFYILCSIFSLVFI